MRRCFQTRLALALAVAALANGQNSKGVAAISVPETQGEAERIAIVVGVSEYSRESGLENLPMAKNDAEDVAAALEKLGYIVSRMPNATAGAVVRSIRESRKLITGTNSTIIFYYSGHGTASPNHENYLMTYGASRERMENEGLGLTELQKELRNTKAQRQVIWIDACRTVPAEGRRSSMDADMFAEMQAASGIRILLATSFGEASWEYPELKHGAFTYQLLKGLEPGSPAYREDGVITFSGLANYVKKETRRWTFEHHHTQVPKESGEDFTGDFLLASLAANRIPTNLSSNAEAALKAAMDAMKRGNYAEARAGFEALAREKNPEAEYQLGLILVRGLGMAKNYSEGLRWFHLAADQGHAEAQFNVGAMYDFGWGAARSDAEALKWYRLAASQGSANGEASLGLMYLQGRGVAQDYAEAARWYGLAAGQGQAYAQTGLGVMYRDGLGVTQSYSEAVKWFRLGADQRIAFAQVNLGSLYMAGRGVAKDEAEGVKLYRLAADQGDSGGQYAVGWTFEFGRGDTRSTTEAIKWYRLAAAQGNEYAKEGLERLGAKQ